MKPMTQPRNRKPSSGKHVPPPVTLPRAPWDTRAPDAGKQAEQVRGDDAHRLASGPDPRRDAGR